MLIYPAVGLEIYLNVNEQGLFRVCAIKSSLDSEMTQLYIAHSSDIFYMIQMNTSF